MADDQNVAKIIRDETDDDDSQSNRIAQWHRLLMHGVGLFVTRYGRFPDPSEVRQLGEIATEIESEAEQPKTMLQ
jgi:hypothetical protein